MTTHNPEQALQSLTREQLELALLVMDKALSKKTKRLELPPVPPQLEHLTEDDWLDVAKVLMLLKHQQLTSEIH